jgi:hypothetical protein
MNVRVIMDHDLHQVNNAMLVLIWSTFLDIHGII